LQNHYPSRREIEGKFKVRIGDIFGGIDNLYLSANLTYKQQNNQELKNKKAKLLNSIALESLHKLNLRLIKSSGVHQKGIDIITKNKKNKRVGIELKAYNKYESIKTKDINQLKRFLAKDNLNKVILITTTNRSQYKLNVPKKVEIIFFDELKRLCKSNRLDNLEFIRNHSIHWKPKYYEKKRADIIKYAKEKANKGEDISYLNISKDLNLDVRTYFKNIYNIYNKANISIPINKIKGFRRSKKLHKETEKARDELIMNMLKYISKEVKQNHYPSGIDIGNEFGISHIWNIVKVSDLYKKIGLEPYHARKKRWLRRR